MNAVADEMVGIQKSKVWVAEWRLAEHTHANACAGVPRGTHRHTHTHTHARTHMHAPLYARAHTHTHTIISIKKLYKPGRREVSLQCFL